MPKKIRELKAILSKAGFLWQPGKGSHTKWTHPALPGVTVIISGKDGNDARSYQEKDITTTLQLLSDALRKLEQEEP